MIIKLTFVDDDGDRSTAEYEVVSAEVQTVDPVQIQPADHGYGIVIKD